MEEEGNYPPEINDFGPSNVIRVETGLSRYPVHRLAKKGHIAIEIQEKSRDGEVLIKWEVSPSGNFGQPGPLAYRVDTLIVNRRIEEADRPIPRIIKLGTLNGILEELGIKTHDINIIKNALLQNALAGIVAKLKYKLQDGTLKVLEAAFNRYSVVFTGEQLPDGRKADAVYLVLNDVFMQVINGAQTRPLDYDYLKGLPPASQRLYELLSFQIYAALRHGRREAKLSYSEFCTHAPLTRSTKWDQVRPQVARIHAPHLKSGYIESVEFEQTIDKDGKPDWLMIYTPGPKAKSEFRTFTKKGGSKTLVVEQTSDPQPYQLNFVANSLEQELVKRGVTPDQARKLVAECPEESIKKKIEEFDWTLKKHPKKVRTPGGYLASSIRTEQPSPEGFVSKADLDTKAAVQAESEKQARREKAQKKAQEKLEEAIKQRIEQYWASLSPEEQKQLDEEAKSNASAEVLETYQAQHRNFKESYFKHTIRHHYIRQFLESSGTEV